MPNRTIYIRNQDLPAWEAIADKPRWIHDALVGTGAQYNKTVKERKEIETPILGSPIPKEGLQRSLKDYELLGSPETSGKPPTVLPPIKKPIPQAQGQALDLSALVISPPTEPEEDEVPATDSPVAGLRIAGLPAKSKALQEEEADLLCPHGNSWAACGKLRCAKVARQRGLL